jgi:hypothetical protein
MKIKPFSAAIGAGTVLALATAIPAAEASAAHHSTTSMSAQVQRLRAIKAEFKAEAEFKKERAEAAQALKAGWYSVPGTAAW